MPNCKVCNHPDVRTIDRYLISGEMGITAICREYGLSSSTLKRHRTKHLASDVHDLIRRDVENQQDSGLDVLSELRRLQVRTDKILTLAENTQDLRTALQAIRESRENWKTVAMLLGDIDTAPTINIIQSPQFVQVQQILIEVLTPYPDILNDVVSRLEGVE